MDFALAELTLGTVISPVVTDLVAAGVDPHSLMVLGAVCRDVLHTAQGHLQTLRTTGDLDLAFAVASEEAYRALTARLERIPNGTGIRFRVASTAVDLVRFGGIEHPDGSVPVPAEPAMNVLGFADVYDTAHIIEFPGAGSIRVPTVAGFAALKLSAWAARSVEGDYRDGGDLACALWWFQQDAATGDRLYTDPDASELLIRYDFDADTAACALLLQDSLGVLQAARQDALRGLWSPTPFPG